MISKLYLPYSTQQFPFRELVEAALMVDDLTRLHEHKDYPHFTRETDQQTEWHDRFYKFTETKLWKQTYQGFISQIRSLIGEELAFQRVPTFRVAFPGNVSVGEPHRDRDYKHSPDEINFWIPLTPAWNTSAVWCETKEGSENYMPLNCDYGQVLCFDGANLKHYNEDNLTGLTRVSFDLRVVPMSVYEDPEDDRATINTHLPFRLPRTPEEANNCYFLKMA